MNMHNEPTTRSVTLHRLSPTAHWKPIFTDTMKRLSPYWQNSVAATPISRAGWRGTCCYFLSFNTVGHSMVGKLSVNDRFGLPYPAGLLRKLQVFGVGEFEVPLGRFELVPPEAAIVDVTR